MSTITSANASVVLTVPDVFAVPQIIAGFAADDAFTQEAADLAETRMGVDGNLRMQLLLCLASDFRHTGLLLWNGHQFVHPDYARVERHQRNDANHEHDQ